MRRLFRVAGGLANPRLAPWYGAGVVLNPRLLLSSQVRTIIRRVTARWQAFISLTLATTRLPTYENEIRRKGIGLMTACYPWMIC